MKRETVAFRVIRFLGAWLVLSGAIMAVPLMNIENSHRGRFRTVTNLAMAEARGIASLVEPAFSAAATVGMLVELGAADPHADLFVQKLVVRWPIIARIFLAPGGVVSRILPGDEPAGVIGRSVFDDDVLGRIAKRASSTGRMSADGPFPLQDGGFGVGVCYPVVRGAGREAAWGYVFAVIRMEDLLRESGLEDLGKKGYRWALSRPLDRDAVSAPASKPRYAVGGGKPPPVERREMPPSVVFASSSGPLPKDPAVVDVPLSQSGWTLSVAPLAVWGFTGARVFAVLLSLAAAAVLTGFADAYIHRNHRIALLADRLEAEIRERADIESRLAASLGEKEILLKEIHHRVKNNLAVIESIVSLESRGAAGTRFEETFRHLSSRIHSVALIHEKLYKGTDLARVEARPYLSDLLSYIRSGIGSEAAEPRLDVDSCQLTSRAALNIGLIATELYTNAVKYGSGGAVAVLLKREGDALRLSVENEGSPLPLGFKEGEGLGLRLVDALAGQMDGTWDAERGPPVRVSVVVPAKGVVAEEAPFSSG